MVRARLAHPSAAAVDDVILDQRNTLRSWIFCATIGEIICILFIFMSGFHLPAFTVMLLAVVAFPNAGLTIRHLWTTQDMEKRRFGHMCCGCCDGPKFTAASEQTSPPKEEEDTRVEIFTVVKQEEDDDSEQPPSARGEGGGGTEGGGQRNSSNTISSRQEDSGFASLNLAETDNHNFSRPPPPPEEIVNHNIGCLGPLGTIKLVARVRYVILLLIAGCVVEILAWYSNASNEFRKDRGGAIAGVVICCFYLIIDIGMLCKFHSLTEICMLDPRIMFTEEQMKNGGAYNFDLNMGYHPGSAGGLSPYNVPHRVPGVGRSQANSIGSDTGGPPVAAGGPRSVVVPPPPTVFMMSNGSEAPYHNTTERIRLYGSSSAKGKTPTTRHMGVEAVSLKMDPDHIQHAVVGAPRGLDPRTGQVHVLLQPGGSNSRFPPPPAPPADVVPLSTSRGSFTVAEGGGHGGTGPTTPLTLLSPSGSTRSLLPSRFALRSEPYGQNAPIGRSPGRVPQVLGYAGDAGCATPPDQHDVGRRSSIPYGDSPMTPVGSQLLSSAAHHTENETLPPPHNNPMAANSITSTCLPMGGGGVSASFDAPPTNGGLHEHTMNDARRATEEEEKDGSLPHHVEQ